VTTYQALRAAGLCPRCGARPPDAPRVCCDACAAYLVAYRKRCREERRCRVCGAEGCERFAACRDCRVRANAAQSAQRRARRGYIPPDPTAADRLAEEVLP
jgi:hypothetical protein